MPHHINNGRLGYKNSGKEKGRVFLVENHGYGMQNARENRLTEFIGAYVCYKLISQEKNHKK